MTYIIEQCAREADSFAVMYSHKTGVDMTIFNRQFRVYKIKIGHSGPPLEGMFVSEPFSEKAPANKLCRELNTKAILAKFRELTAEPTDAMLKAATNVVKNYHGPDSLPCKAAMRAMNEQMWEDVLDDIL